MRKLMTIGELAKMFEITSSKIRYYEKREIFTHSKTSDNGYSLYSFDDLNKLEIILLLRGMNVSLETIKGLLKGYNKSDYSRLLCDLEKESLRQISELKKKVKVIRQRRDSLEDFVEQSIKIIELPKISLYILENVKLSKQTEKEFFDFSNSHGLVLSNYEDKYYFLLKGDDLSVLVSTKNKKIMGFPIYEIPAGKYLQINNETKKDTPLDITLEEVHKKINDSGYQTIGELLILENYQQFLFSNISQCETFIIRIKVEND
jgi:DNA-binding transcriptional MerR regulator